MAPQQNEQTSTVESQIEEEGKVSPRQYQVIMHNDDYTTMEFVIEVLMGFFRKTNDEAVEIMLKVHNEGRAVCGIYSYEIAETKVMQVHDYAKQSGYPLRCSMEPHK